MAQDDNYFDLAIVDPPYGIKVDIEQNKSGIVGTKAKLKDIKEKLYRLQTTFIK